MESHVAVLEDAVKEHVSNQIKSVVENELSSAPEGVNAVEGVVSSEPEDKVSVSSALEDKQVVEAAVFRTVVKPVVNAISVVKDFVNSMFKEQSLEGDNVS